MASAIISVNAFATDLAVNVCPTDLEMEDDFVFGTWRSPPKVILCDDAPISEERLISALDWWGNRGHRFKYVPLAYRSDKKRYVNSAEVAASCNAGGHR